MPLPLDRTDQPEERVARQLVAAMAYEGLINAGSSLGRGRSAEIRWTSAAGAFRCAAWSGPFGRVRIAGGSLQVERPDGTAGQPTLAELVGSIRAAGAAKGRLLQELEATAAACRLVDEEMPWADRRSLSFDGLDAALHEGHPYHPSFKARLGFTADDTRAYGPEFGNAFQLVWVAVPRQRMAQALPAGEDVFVRGALGAEGWACLGKSFAAAGLSHETHGLMPVHPWQWSRLQRRFQQAGIRHLGVFGDRYRASQSVRTLINADRPGEANVKLPLDMVNSSTVRTLDPPSVLAAPVLSNWLAEAIDADRLFDERYPLAILKEFAGITAERDGALEGQLGAIWRESVTGKCAPGEAAVPLNALTVVEPDGRPLIENWVRRHGLFRLVDRLIETVVMPLWHLLVAHGIATECHGQNLILVHRDGWPARLVLRDFHDSLEYVPGYLTAPDPKAAIVAADPAYADPTPNRFFWMDDVEELRGLLMDSLFVHTLSDVSLNLEHGYGFPEAEFWRRVARRLETYAGEHGLQSRQDELRHRAPLIPTEPLLRRKLGLWHGGPPHHVENDFWLHSPERKEDDHDQDRRQVL